MFKIDLDDVKDFRSAMEALGNLIDEGEFSITKKGMGLHALDPSQIAMVIFNMPDSAFSNYEADSEQKVGVKLDNFNKILSRGKGSRMSLYDMDNKLVVEFKGEKSKKSFKIPIIEIGPGVEREPKVEHDVNIAMRASALKDAVRDVSLVSSHITLEAKGKTLKISASGDDAEAEVEFEQGEDSGIKEMEVKNAARATFPVQYLDDMIKGAEDSSDIKIALRTNAPIKISYSLGNAEFTYYLAPRIDLE